MHGVVELAHWERKPNVDVLHHICRNEGVEPANTVYIGDSLTRDVLMAKNAGVFAAWAEYGVDRKEHLYGRLVRVSHWDEVKIRREMQLSAQAKGIVPDFIARKSIADILTVFG